MPDAPLELLQVIEDPGLFWLVIRKSYASAMADWSDKCVRSDLVQYTIPLRTRHRPLSALTEADSASRPIKPSLSADQVLSQADKLGTGDICRAIHIKP